MSDQTEWDKLDEHLHGKRIEESTIEGSVTRFEDSVVISVGSRIQQKLPLGVVRLNGVVLYDTRTWKTGDIISMTEEE